MGGEVTYLNQHDDGGRADKPDAGHAAHTIEQVRELLYGEALRGHGRRVEDAHEALGALEQRMLQRFGEVEASIEALARQLRTEHGTSVRSIGNAIVEMGRQIASQGEIHDRCPDHQSS